jgi:hypothetical protein
MHPIARRAQEGLTGLLHKQALCRLHKRMRRREFVQVAATLATWPIAAGAQQKARPVIGFLSGRSAGEAASFVAAFHQGLAETTPVEGQNVGIEYRWAEGRYDRLPEMAADLVSRKVNVIATSGGNARCHVGFAGNQHRDDESLARRVVPA